MAFVPFAVCRFHAKARSRCGGAREQHAHGCEHAVINMKPVQACRDALSPAVLAAPRSAGGGSASAAPGVCACSSRVRHAATDTGRWGVSMASGVTTRGAWRQPNI